MDLLKLYTLAAALAVAALVAGPLLDGQPSEAEAEAAMAADLRDALARAQAERPDLWTDADRVRADVAAAIAAHHAVRGGRP